MKTLKVIGRYLAYDDGTPFFYLGDTAWEIFHRLDREDMAHYFSVRAAQGFNAVQGVALAEFEGVTVPNGYGRLPLLFTDELPDPSRPDTEGEYSYWDHVDYAVALAAEHEMFITLLPTWGDKYNIAHGKGPVIFNEENAYLYGRWIAHRYKDAWNIIWMLGGDRRLEEEHRRIVDAMARGIREVDSYHLITFHPPGHTDSTDFVLDAPYIDFHTAQTGHAVLKSFCSDDVMRKMARTTDLPYMDSEPRYEDHPACFDASIGYFWGADEVRQNAYWDIFTGACGHTYGNHCVWSMTTDTRAYFPYTWKDALTHPGAGQMKYAKALRLSRDYFSLVPADDIVTGSLSGMGHMTAAKGDGYAYVYSPLGIPFEVRLDLFENVKAIRALWFDPRTGKETVFSVLPTGGRTYLVPPTQGKGCDWILILEAVPLSTKA